MNKFPIAINFTPSQWQIIVDRLEIPSAIADALTDVEEGEEAKWTDRDEIIDRAFWMSASGPGVMIWNELDFDILIDAVEGSTMPSRLKDTAEYGTPAEQREARSLLKQIKPLERMLFAAGVDATFPKF